MTNYVQVRTTSGIQQFQLEVGSTEVTEEVHMETDYDNYVHPTEHQFQLDTEFTERVQIWPSWTTS